MALPVILVTRQLPLKVLNQLTMHGHVVMWEPDCPVTREWLLDHISRAEALYCLLTDSIDRDVILLGKRLRVISSMSVGVDHIDVAACTNRGIPVGHTPGVLTETTADLAFGLLMAAARRIEEGAGYVRQGRWTTWSPDLLLGRDIYGATLGIIGFGRIGQAVARRALGFNMKVLVAQVSRSRPKEGSPIPSPGMNVTDTFHQWTWHESLESGEVKPAPISDVLTKSDFLSLHVPLTDDTCHMIGANELRTMKPTAILVNTARGGVVETEALYLALKEGIIGAAALDVTDPEPLPASHPLLSLSNCLVIPHLGSATVATRGRMALMAAENVIAGLKGDHLPYCINPHVYDA
ncbi:MAG: 2-hydroxyacid dehydrogenase [Nitrospirales bacterium]|nr:D-glycerate dehydrogenase [Nitrospirales bacterium]